jgi:hypothetical protein
VNLDRILRLTLGGGAAAFGVLGVVAPGRLSRLTGGSDDASRALGFRDLGNAMLFAAGPPRVAIAQRMLYDVGDAVVYGRRAKVAAGALAFAALGAVAFARS